MPRPVTYDLDDAVDRMAPYRQVPAEGLDEDDVRRFIRVDVLVELWDALPVPEAVRTAWAGGYGNGAC